MAQKAWRRNSRCPKDSLPPITDIGTDAEFDYNDPDDPWLFQSFSNSRRKIGYFNPLRLTEATAERVRAKAQKEGYEVVLDKHHSTTCLLLDFLNRVEMVGGDDKKNLRINLLFYWSGKDLEYSLGEAAFYDAVEGGTVAQRNVICGEINLPGVTVRLHDLMGYAAKDKLETFSEGMGIVNPHKKLMQDEDKGRMEEIMNRRPEDFLAYAMSDADVLPLLKQRFCQHWQTLMRDCLHIPEDQIMKPNKMPITAGALDARTVETWLFNCHGIDHRLLRLAARKVGILDPNAFHNDDRERTTYRRAFQKYNSLDAIWGALNAGDRDLRAILKFKFKHTALSGAGVRWWASRPETDTAIYHAPVQGGRCNSEDPLCYRLLQGNDADLKGCYGDCLRSLIFPLGLPTFWSRMTQQETGWTLGEWHAEHKRNLVDGLWLAVVKGRLNFAQDCLFSKVCKPGDIARAIRSEFDPTADDQKIPADFGLLRREIVNAHITADMMKYLRKIATDAEWKGLMNLEVVTAAAYLKSDRVETAEEWCETIFTSTGEFRTITQSQVEDSRSRAWLGVPLEGYVGALVDRRSACGRILQDPASKPHEREAATGLDRSLKLSINVCYGSMASQHFAISNTIVASNVTARARLCVWMLSKSLNLKQTITDGGVYSPLAVRSWKGRKKPGLATLANTRKWDNTSNMRYTRPLPGFEWDRDVREWDQKLCDMLAMEHNRKFWEPYFEEDGVPALDFPYQVAHKKPFARAWLGNKADYSLQIWDNEDADPCKHGFTIKHKSRGKYFPRKIGGKYEYIPHPQILEAESMILTDTDDFPEYGPYESRRALTVKGYKRLQASPGATAEEKALKVGDFYTIHHRSPRLNNTHFPAETLADLMRRRRRNTRKIDGEFMPLFEKFRHLGKESVLAHMDADDLREPHYKRRKN